MDDEEQPAAAPNAFDVLMSGPQAKKQKVDQLVFAVIYIRVLRHISESEPLRGCPYIGQAVRAGYKSAGELAAQRWREENQKAVREDKSVGLIACLDDFGPEAFQDEVFEWKYGPRSEVQEWANEREIELIAVHGGTLRDPSISCKQTLNLMKGGKAVNSFESRQALNKMQWLKFQREMLKYVESFGDALVPSAYEAPSGYTLGSRVSMIRHSGTFWKAKEDEEERVAWLNSLAGWSWSPHDDAWTQFQHEMKLYVNEKQTSLVPRHFESASGYKLGDRLNDVRSSGRFWKNHTDKKQRMEWLEALPKWSWRPHDDAWIKFQYEMNLYVDEKKTSSVPQNHISASGYPLGSRLNTIRHLGTYWKGHDDETERVAWLEALTGWSWDSRDDSWAEFQHEIKLYVDANHTASVPESFKTTSGYPLGRKVCQVRNRGIFWKGKEDEAERVAWLSLLPRWSWNPFDERWEEFKREIQLYVDEKHIASVPKKYKSASGYRLGPQLDKVRHQGSFWKGKDDEAERVAWLQALPGWSWSPLDDAWTQFQHEMQLYVDEKNSALAPLSYKAASGYPLGKRLSKVRQGHYWKGKDYEAERVAWLTALPEWRWLKKKS